MWRYATQDSQNVESDSYSDTESSEYSITYEPKQMYHNRASPSASKARNQRKDCEPPVRAFKKTVWEWTSDEDDDNNEESMPDIGYMTMSKTCSSSESRPDINVRPRQVRKPKVNSKDDDDEQRYIRCIPVECKTEKIKARDNGQRRVVGVHNARVTSSLNVKVIAPVSPPRLALCLPQKTPSKQSFGEDFSTTKQGQEKQDKPVESGFTKAVKYGLAAVSVGLGGYIVYKICTRK